MRESLSRILIATACCAVWLVGCEDTTQTGLQTPSKSAALPHDAALGVIPVNGTVATRPATPEPTDAAPEDGNLSLGKRQFQAANFSLAEQYFRRAVTDQPRNAEAWLGLAASYDRLNRVRLADRAYAEAVTIAGAGIETLNRQSLAYATSGNRPATHDTFVTQANFNGQEME